MTRETYLETASRLEHESFQRSISAPKEFRGTNEYVSPARMALVVDALTAVTQLTTLLISKAVLNPHSFVIGNEGETVKDVVNKAENLVKRANEIL